MVQIGCVHVRRASATRRRLCAGGAAAATSSQVWADISMDFIEGLPKVGGKSVILTVVDRFSKYAHFIALGHPYTASRWPAPSSTASSAYTGFRPPSTAFHPQTDGQSEVVNKVIAMYLRCVTVIALALGWIGLHGRSRYNTSYHSALRATPFEVVYGRPPSPILPVDPTMALTEAAGELIRARDEMLAEVQQRLVRLEVTKHYYDGRHREVEYAVGDGCGFAVAPLTGPSTRVLRKLGPRYVGPSSSWSGLGPWRTDSRCPRGPAFTTSSTWGCKPYRGAPPVATPPLRRRQRRVATHPSQGAPRSATS
ncbi:hypothetical protein QYE76_061302 [Lolium multiflorum]|uniref:Integrase catalytic domain-containing protein n=1 Tax=Lolium multiflorum TaxID=4521 RepID=A0AAD8S3P9_LOLMU|nr:hypothetical protein QYE76_061302 [Lolium multiflorum]